MNKYFIEVVVAKNGIIQTLKIEGRKAKNQLDAISQIVGLIQLEGWEFIKFNKVFKQSI